MSRLTSSGIVACFAIALAVAGCKQGLGERCEQNSDCSSGFCSVPAGPPSAEGGKCCASADTCPGATGTGGSTGIVGIGGSSGSGGSGGSAGSGDASMSDAAGNVGDGAPDVAPEAGSSTDGPMSTDASQD